jgi:hypothetical protein
VLLLDLIVEGDVREARGVVGGGVFDGEDESPLPSMFGTMMKYLAGSKAMPSPISHSLSQWRPEYQVGYTIALVLSAFSAPYVLYTSLASRSVAPCCNVTSPRSKIS